ncbi:hypothetical protein BOTBODRAFT_382877 [Botryobasidium botryosum FD-172 SS1]|uniref:Uncharacterized protein n=1 Tax=Botryobasidium botryosum (strain FD-172 SS1) TaxID=930990 RepID=A0A067MWJ1_BOTB1|nr:hypothetical protein BOTBODRAFT_382877 [Botryobasidium botryosum FD-172 SS1]
MDPDRSRENAVHDNIAAINPQALVEQLSSPNTTEHTSPTDPDDFKAWARGAGVHLRTTYIMQPNGEEFDPPGLPKDLEAISIERSKRLQIRWVGNFYQDLSLREMTSAEDKYGVCGIIDLLAVAFARIRSASTRGSGAVALRRGVDDIIECAFSFRLDRTSCKTLLQQKIAVRDSKTFPTAWEGSALVDILITIPFHSKDARKLDELYIAEQDSAWEKGIDYTWATRCYYWSLDSDPGIASLIGFACEVARYPDELNVERRLAIVLSTAQSQRKALGLKDRVLHGAVVEDHTLTIYEAYWGPSGKESKAEAADHIFVQRTAESFDLYRAERVVACYEYLSKIHHSIKGMAGELDHMTWVLPKDDDAWGHWRVDDPLSERAKKLTRDCQDQE